MDVLSLQRETTKSSALIQDVGVRMCGGGGGYHGSQMRNSQPRILRVVQKLFEITKLCLYPSLTEESIGLTDHLGWDSSLVFQMDRTERIYSV